MLNIRILFTNYDIITDFLNLAFCSEHFISIKYRILCCISIFGVFINGWMFTDGYIAAIRNLGLARFRFVLYTFSDGNPRR
jgi:hypothetical protein